ncbi:putative secreted protein (Por secretion system target) [Lutibacter sp. Hel_I_33_5]|uniref:T9SS type A sorting domain-containing protein n=1 Tax=Lutibacter sp. Hel_I_33_5 TaxID=1566289 RepID=UPI0011A0C41A|nr:T9SS type A sorting domain-containing protein [Lutibacter sp. Hel_I_33_5]TVZ57228.1 putative secreted protein (Por secretion system target) [Lutibacter sp. Hel_I_33_5]
MIKKITLVFFLVTTFGFSQTTLLDFESATTWTDFDGGAVTTIANPQNNSDNSSAKVGQMVKSAGQTWGGSWTQLASAPDFANNNTLTMKVYSPRVGAKVLLKVENAADGAINFEKQVETTKANAWETLSFDYSTINSTNSYEKVIIIFDNGTMGDGTANFTFLIDDVVLSNVASTTTIALPLDFESATSWGDFDGGAVTTENNPMSNADNNSAKVGKMVKSAGQTWGGSSLVLSAAMDFASNNTFTMKFNSPRVGAKVLLKVENSGVPAENFEKEVLTTVANAWETLTFDYSGIDKTKSYDKLVVIIDNGTMGDGTANFTFYMDDISLSNVVPTKDQIDLPVDFEGTTVDFTVTDFGNNESSLVADPTDATNMVIKTIKKATAETWSGTTVGKANGFKTVIPFTASVRKMNVRVWSPDANTPVRLKVEESGDNTHSVETEVNTTVAGGWEILEFDFDSQATGTAAFDATYTYNKASLFFNFGTDGATAGEKIYYFDDVKFGAASTSSVVDNDVAKISMYPNPSKNNITISSKEKIENITIYNILGKSIRTINVDSNSKNINVSDLNAGIYMVKYSANGKIGTAKFIKQ